MQGPKDIADDIKILLITIHVFLYQDKITNKWMNFQMDFLRCFMCSLQYLDLDKTEKQLKCIVLWQGDFLLT